MTPTQPVSPQPTPLDVGKRCALSSGGDPTAMGACIVQNLPNNVAQQCLANPAACFGELDPVYWNITVLNKAADLLGVDLSKPAKIVDEVFGGIRDILDFF
ncbi:MAG: hypothetical protein KDI55_27245 [Anaerolineae bacterium]|nr:hypothetical protein [Anaerolineae bacterium]